MLWKPPIVTEYAQFSRKPSKTHVAGLLLAISLLLKVRQRLREKAKSAMSSPAKWPAIPGFKALSDQVFVREPQKSDEPAPADHPDVVMVYGWGDGLPKHVAKYAEGFRTIFPQAKQILVLSPISRAMFNDLPQRSDLMLPVVHELFPDGPDAKGAPKKILAHTMSNTGAVNYASMLNAFRDLYGVPFPHQLLTMDSTPGSTHLDRSNLVRWSRAMALGTAKAFPWPFVVTQSMWAVFLLISNVYFGILGRESAGGWSRKAANNEAFETKGARKLYMYSKEDDLIGWEDIEVHVAETRKRGWQADVEVFEGSGHVGHMRMHGEQYWNAIVSSWKRAIEES